MTHTGGEESIFCNLLGHSRRNVDRQNNLSHETTHDHFLPDGEKGLGREQVLGPSLDIGLRHLDLSDHELNLLLADATQVPVGG